MSPVLERVIFFGILAEIIFSALAYGTTTAWAAALFKTGAAALMLVWVIKCIVDKRLHLNLPPTVWPIVALLAVGLLQSLALTDATGQRYSLSLDVEATRMTVTMLLSLLILFLLTANFLNTPERLRLLVNVLVVYGMALALFALVQQFTCESCLYWVKASTGSPFGPFPNRNHFAGYIELLMPVPLAILTVRAAGKWSVMYAFAAVLTGIAAVMSLSRGGLLVLSVELIFVAVMSKRVHGRWRRQTHEPRRSIAHHGWLRFGPPAFVGLLILAGVFWIGSAPIGERLTRTMTDFNDPKASFTDGRLWIWKNTVSLIKANPLLGVGIGAFPTAFTLYDQSNGLLEIGAAHNDYLQLVADAGLLGALIGLWFVIVVIRAIARATACKDRFLAGLALGAATGVIGILVHSLFDFNLQIPSNALLFLVFVAVISHLGTVANSDLQTSAAPAPTGPNGLGI